MSPLLRRQRHRQNGVRPGRSDGRRRDQVILRAERVLGNERGGLREGNRVVYRGRGARRQQAGGEEIALAGGAQLRSLEDVDVLLDDLADEDQQVVRHDTCRGIRRLLQFRDDPLRDDGRLRRPGLHVVAKLPRRVVANQHREDQHGNGRHRHESQKEPAIEADAQLADQFTSEPVPLGGQRPRQRQDQHPRAEGGAGQGDDLGQADQVIEQRERRVAERVDARAVVRDVDVRHPPAGLQRRPERLPRRVDALEQRVVNRPRGGTVREERTASPSIDRQVDAGIRRTCVRWPRGRAEHFVIGVLRRNEGQRPVVEGHVNDHGAGDGVGGRHVARPRQAHAAFRVQHAALLGAEGEHFAVDLPIAARPQERGHGGGVGKVQGETAHEGTVRAVQLDRRRQAKSGEIRSLPHGERRVEGRRPVRRTEDLGRQRRACEQYIHLSLCLREAVQERRRMIGGRRSDFVLDQPLFGGQPVVHDRRIRQHGGHDERPEDGREPSRFGCMAKPGADARCRQRHGDHAGEQGEVRPGRNSRRHRQQQARRRCAAERPQAGPVQVAAPAGFAGQQDGDPQPDGRGGRQQQTQQQADPRGVQRVVRPLQQVGQ